MRSFARIASALAALVLLPALAVRTASITGTVRDASGAVLPGVTVEASSPALIEKVRATVTDGAGLYRIVDLRPGTYTVTFTLPGFATVKREGIELTGSVTLTIPLEMKVGDARRKRSRSPARRRSSTCRTRGARRCISADVIRRCRRRAPTVRC